MNQKPVRETSKAIVAYPTLEVSDIELIEGLRKVHDPRLSPSSSIHPDLKRLGFVFHEATVINQANLIQRLEENFADFKAFDFVIRYSVLHEVHDIGGFSIDLIPTEGIDSFLKISSIIHTQILINVYCFQTIPCIPLSWRKKPNEAKEIMNQINQEGIEISGHIESLCIREWKHDRTIPIIHEFPLKSYP